MTIDEFWNLIDEVHREGRGLMEAKCNLLQQRMEALRNEEVLSFYQHFEECRDRLYDWQVWCAAYVIHGGCGDDAFMDFRATIVSLGREIFERTKADPDSLAEIELETDELFYQGFQYPAPEVYEKRTGQRVKRLNPHPRTPSGTEWDEKDADQLSPKLAAKFKRG